MQDTGNSYNNAIQLGHEAYRDGIVDNNNTAETLAAVLGHTEMAERMKGYGVSFDQSGQLGMDMAVYEYAMAQGDMSLFNAYAGGSYDSSADYWKLMNDGTLVNDNSGWLTDENGNVILNADGEQIGANGIETGLLNILFGGTHNKSYNSYSDREISIAQTLMIQSGMSYTNGETFAARDRSWAGNEEGQEMNMYNLMYYTGNTVAAQVFARYYDSTVDSQIADYLGVNIGTVNTNRITDSALSRYENLYSSKLDFYLSATSLVDSENTKISGAYKDYIYTKDKDGKTVINTEYYQNYENQHYGIDIGKLDSQTTILGASILGALSGKITSNAYDDNEGWTVHANYGYEFEDNLVSLGINGEYGHMATQSSLAVGSVFDADTALGTVGNSGLHSSGTHLHYTMYTMSNTYYSATTMQILLGMDYSLTAMNNGYGKIVYDPTQFYNTYRRKR